jgi:hypothetical protein
VKKLKDVNILVCFLIAALVLNASQSYSQSGSVGTPADQVSLKMTLNVIRAFDMRLPVLSDDDFKAVLKEAKGIISAKLGNKIKINFSDNGIILLDDLFKDKSYRKVNLYKKLSAWQYDLNQGEKLSLLNTKKFKKYIIKFLRQWDINSLRDFFPDKAIRNYEDVFYNLMNVYHSKVKWIKTLKINNYENLVIEPLPPYQSYVEWIGYMWNQNQYDIVLTNGLIIYDHLSEPYPHAISKHAKVGGSSFFSPKRTVLGGRSLMVNIFGEYGNIQEICNSPEKSSKELKNKILGGFYLAHEFGHAFYMIPDVYDHGDTCLMNSSLQNLDNVKGYNLLISDLSACHKCQLWIIAKESIIKAGLAYKNLDYNRAAELYIKGANETPKLVDGSYKLYIKGIYEKALISFQKANNKDGEKEMKRMIDNLSGTIGRSN